MKKQIELLKDDAHYYGKEGKKYLSNSDIYSLLKNPRDFRADKPSSVPMLEGGYFHTSMLEPEKLDSFSFVDASTRNTKIYKEAVEQNNNVPLLLQKEKEHLDDLIGVMKGNETFFADIYAEGNVFEEPAIKEIHGVLWKGKADIITKNEIIDIKTTSDIDRFRFSANAYNYDSQCFLYEQFFGKPMVFYVICKKSKRLSIFRPSQEFIDRGESKVLRAIEIYNEIFVNKEVSLDNYYNEDVL